MTHSELTYRPTDTDYANALIDVAHDLTNEGRNAEAEQKLAEAEAILNRISE